MSLAWTLLAAALAGPHAISGQVLDRAGKPVDRAIVSLMPANVELVTDREGRFLIDYARNPAGSRVRLARKVEYTLEVFRPGYHTVRRQFFFKRGALVVEGLTLAEETVSWEDPGENLDPAIYADPTHSAGASYEGQ